MTSNEARRSKVLFVCTGNTCRSVLAEYLGRRDFGDSVTVESAGVSPQSAADAQNAIFTLKNNFGIDASGHIPRDVRTLNMADYDLTIALEKHAAAVARELGAPSTKVKLWKIHDPWGGDMTEYDRVSLEIIRKLSQLKASGGGHETEQGVAPGTGERVHRHGAGERHLRR